MCSGSVEVSASDSADFAISFHVGILLYIYALKFFLVREAGNEYILLDGSGHVLRFRFLVPRRFGYTLSSRL
jgi:hypothetical protein